MSGFVMTNAKVLLGGMDFSGQHNSLALEYGAEMLDETTFQVGGAATRKNKAGLKTFSFNGNIFWDSDTDEVLFNRIAAAREVMSFAPTGEAEGDRVLFTRAVNATYNPASGEIGQLLQATMEGRNSNQALVRGQLMKSGSVSVTGNSSGIQFSPTSAMQRIFSALHVLTPATGGVPSITVTIQSAAAANFAGATTRLTHATLTAKGADWQEAAGPVTDMYWRAVWTISGSESFSIYHSFGIQ